MKLIVNDMLPHTYTRFRQLSFSPETSTIGDQSPINEIIADIVVDNPDEIGIWMIGDDVKLTNDVDTVFADDYCVTAVKQIDKRTWRVTAKSKLTDYDNAKTRFSYYKVSDNVTFQDIFEDIADVLTYNPPDYYIDPDVASNDMYGLIQWGNARDYLNSLCLTNGAYIKTFNNSRIEILRIPYDTIHGAYSGTPTPIPKQDTYYKPVIEDGDVVTSVTFITHSIYEVEHSDLPYIEDPDGHKYWYDTYEDKHVNPYIDNDARGNDLTIETWFHATWDTLYRNYISEHFFRNATAEVDVINNGSYWPGQWVSFWADDATQYCGVIASATFTFGLQARAKLKIESVVQYNPA